jgi:hypothetical protein
MKPCGEVMPLMEFLRKPALPRQIARKVSSGSEASQTIVHVACS